MKLLIFMILASKRPHDADAGQVFLYDGGQLAFGLIHPLEKSRTLKRSDGH